MEKTKTVSFVSLEQKTLDLGQVKIFTDRLHLRPVSMKDDQAIFENFTEKVTKYMVPPSQEIEEIRKFIRSSQKKVAEGNDLSLSIFERKTNEFLGCCGLHARMQPNTPELGIWIKESAHGHGYGREAIYALKAWADQFIQYDYLIYPVDRNNQASKKIPQSLGGEIHEEKIVPTMSGGTLDEVIFHIFP